MIRRMRPRATLPGVASCLALVASCSPAPARLDSSGRLTASIVEVVDGDTVVVRVGGGREKVRLIGIDTPETKHPDKPVQCWGPEASARTASILPPGTRVHLERDAEARDAYGRLLLYVFRSDDGLFVNLELVAGGHAVPLPFPPNTSHAAEFADAATRAEESGLGLWGACRG